MIRPGRAVLILSLALLTGCSSIRLAYDNADAWIRWRASGYFDLQGEALEELDRRIAAYHAWHRARVLPQIAKVAEEAAQRIERGLSRADVDRIYAALEAQIRESVRAGAREAAGLLDRLEPAQLAHFERRLEVENRTFAKEHLRGTSEERRKRRLKRTVERLEDWTGPLSEEQLKHVRRYNDTAPMLNELRDRDRKRLQSELVSMLRAREAGKRLPEWAANWDRNREPNYSSAFREARAAYTELLLQLAPTLSVEQRASVASRMRGLAADFEHLARR